MELVMLVLMQFAISTTDTSDMQAEPSPDPVEVVIPDMDEL
jgi:hypothetical protein